MYIMGSIVLPTQVSLPPSMCDCFLPEKCVLKCISKLQIRQFTYLIQPLQPVDFPELNQPAGYNPFNPKGYNPISGLNATLVKKFTPKSCQSTVVGDSCPSLRSTRPSVSFTPIHSATGTMDIILMFKCYSIKIQQCFT